MPNCPLPPSFFSLFSLSLLISASFLSLPSFSNALFHCCCLCRVPNLLLLALSKSSLLQKRLECTSANGPYSRDSDEQ
ncbi:hypothetical protein B0T25DRAFT_229218 [Lasiosphaeria hispida]|uniref:Secreted protein n=1 Tax=Lasiosphaeria hispida TaxID=260671 RepID=A0AAJ0MC36_9PEZI|nr:hypothetical protein B0T25DRAFT_229218 [Lasiosphaeria hispida]